MSLRSAMRSLFSLRIGFAGIAFLPVWVLAPNVASAQCTDTFDNAFTRGLVGTSGIPYQELFPLGVGASLNAVVSTMNSINTSFLSPSSAFVYSRSSTQAGQMSGGVWGRVVGGVVETNTQTTGKIDTSKALGDSFNGGLVPVNPVTGTGTCRGQVKETYAGFQFGFDLGSLNINGGGGNIHFGVMAGYFGSRSKDITDELAYQKVLGNSTLDMFSPQGSFRTDTQVPFLGLYGVFTQGNFFADAQVRQDFYLMRMTDPLNGLSDQPQQARGISVGGNFGYKIPLSGDWFIEPSGGMIYSLVRVDEIDTPGSSTFNFLNAGTVKIDDIESIMGRASFRVGTTIKGETVTSQPFVTGTVFHEFAKDATATSRVGGPVQYPCTLIFSQNLCNINGVPTFFHNEFRDQVLTTSTSRVGTFYQVGIGSAATFGNSGWLGYGRADFKFGDNVDGWNLSAGLRYHW